jgi:O-antigen/teichoic acid export membrane protein
VNLGWEDKTITEISRRRLTSDSAWSIVSATANLVFGFAYIVVVGNYWGSSGLGIFSLCVSLYLVGSVLFNVGIHNAVLYEVAASGEDKERASGFVYTALLSSLTLGLLGGAVSYVLAGSMAAVFRKPQMAGMVEVFALALPLFLVNKTALGVLNAHRRMRLIAAVDVMRDGIMLIYLIGVAILKADFVTIPYGFVLAESLIAVLLLTACFRTHRLAAPSLRCAKGLTAFGCKVALSGVIGMINSRLDILVIGFFLYTSGEKQKLHRTMDVLLRQGTVLFIFIGLVIIAFIKPLISLFYPGQPDMLGAAIALFFLMPGTVITAGYVMIGTATSSSIGMPGNALKTSWIVLGINLVLNFLLVPRLAGIGAAMATTVSLLGGLAYFRYLANKHLDFVVPVRKFSVLFAAFCLLTALSVKFEGVGWGLGFLVIGSIVMVAVLLILQMVRKSDWNLIQSILKSFTKS